MSNGLLGNLGNLVNLLGGYYGLQEGAQDYSALGQSAVAGGELLGQQAIARTQFQPYTVTSALADIGTTPQGGVSLALSPEQRAMQQARFEQAEGLFGRVGVDPTQAASEYYESIRAVQRPEEERMRQGLAQGLFSSGRGGITSREFGTTAEEFGLNKAIAEAQLGASASAREQALAEQQQALRQAGTLTGLGYQPQREALNLFGAAEIPAQLAAAGQTTGAEIAAQAGQAGLEGLIQSQEMSNALQLAAIRQALPMLSGGADAVGDAISDALGLEDGSGNVVVDIITNLLTGGGGGDDGIISQPINNIGGGGSYSTQDSDGDGIYDWLDSAPNDPNRA